MTVLIVVAPETVLRVASAVVAQLDPAELRLRVKVPGQQPCLEDAHNAAAAAFESSVVTSLAVLNCVAFVALVTSNIQTDAKNDILSIIDLVHGRSWLAFANLRQTRMLYSCTTAKLVFECSPVDSLTGNCKQVQNCNNSKPISLVPEL